MFRLKIRTDNAAFEGGMTVPELARMLRKLAAIAKTEGA